MYFITKEQELLGKEIVFTQFAQFTEAMVIVTKDKGIFVVSQFDDEVHIYKEYKARNHILNDSYLREELHKLGIITKQEIENYKKKIEEKWKKEQEETKKRTEEREYTEYLRLKEKYENKKE